MNKPLLCVIGIIFALGAIESRIGKRNHEKES
jgi:hypothetical protein